jgi:hypothetical protein
MSSRRHQNARHVLSAMYEDEQKFRFIDSYIKEHIDASNA